MFNNDERYWDIHKLNKWFAISSILFLISMAWTFIDDNDDEFKIYQREFRKMEIEITEKNLEKEIGAVSAERVSFEEDLADANFALDSKKEKLHKLEEALVVLNGQYYNENMIYQGQKAEVDGLKYLVEADNAHQSDTEDHGPSHEDDYAAALDLLHTYKLIKETSEVKISKTEDLISALKTDVKVCQDDLNIVLKNVIIVDNKLKKIDRERMTFANKVGDVVRDLPIIDFLDPYYKINQVVVRDVKYDVNFATVPKVDRCTSCHLGIENPDFSDAPQPYTTHPNLDLYITSSSPHALDKFGCTSCHAGRGRGTSFVSSTHTPSNEDEKAQWQEDYDWEVMHHWLQPMLPTQYTEASCFKCHNNDLDLKGADQLNLGLSLVDKSGCNGCHVIQDYQQMNKVGPNLTKLNDKVSREWVAKWIKSPKEFRHNTKMPSQFGQENQNTPEMESWNEAEIFAISSYLVPEERGANSSPDYRFIGDAENGQYLFESIGCLGCHVVEPEPIDSETTLYEQTKQHGPNLIGVGSKTSAEWVYNWIKDPLAYNPETLMPNLRVSDGDAKDITAYIMASKNKKFEKLPDVKLDEKVLDGIAFTHLSKQMPESFADKKLGEMSLDAKLNYVAKKSITHYGCFGCHNIDGFENAKPNGVELTEEGSKPISKLDFGLLHDIEHTNHAWFEAKLRTPRIFDRGKVSPPLEKLKMPNFDFNEIEIQAITTAILGFNGNIVEEKIKAHNNIDDMAQLGGRLVKQYNCQGCHLINDFGGQLGDIIGAAEYSPPNLNTEGKKANPDWLLSFLKDPSIIRPNLQVKMPSFHQVTDEEWNAIIKYFQQLDNEKIAYRADLVFDKNSLEFKGGEMLHELGACNNCHFYGTTFPKQDASTWAPNLALTKERLNPDWVKEWLRDPQTIMPGTKMPAPYLPSEDLLILDGAELDWGTELVKMNGDTEAMLNGLRDYLWSIEGKTNIDKTIKDYFEKNGYKFGEDEEDEEDDWGDDDW
ncbi:MAG: c-type cytochrome [Rhodobacteraceae bacterium]|jgi:cbb3-type cytochrome oxidase cytochrome c subunit|nr:c-type cytochrome [Paracoccaceae bacterium]|tara:strand:+ start:18004 stop:20982 length:2979 start_codon:yes stop_codon:yes gene_type:complete